MGPSSRCKDGANSAGPSGARLSSAARKPSALDAGKTYVRTRLSRGRARRLVASMTVASGRGDSNDLDAENANLRSVRQCPRIGAGCC